MEVLIKNIDGREIIIKYKKDLIKYGIKNLISELLSICERNKESKLFPKLTFIFLDFYGRKGISLDTYAFIDPKDLEEGDFIIYISDRFLLGDPERFDSNFFEVITHDLAHLWHEYSTKVISKQKAIALRLIKSLQKNVDPKKGFHAKIRLELMLFFRYLFTEGLAEYCTYLYKRKINFTSDRYNNILANAQASAKELDDEWIFVLNKLSGGNLKGFTKFFRLLESYKYKIGLHMFHAILYKNKDMTLKKLSKAKLSRFFILYGDAMLKDNKEPLASYTSGAGVLDYKRMLSQLSKTYK